MEGCRDRRFLPGVPRQNSGGVFAPRHRTTEAGHPYQRIRSSASQITVGTRGPACPRDGMACPKVLAGRSSAKFGRRICKRHRTTEAGHPYRGHRSGASQIAVETVAASVPLDGMYLQAPRLPGWHQKLLTEGSCWPTSAKFRIPQSAFFLPWPPLGKTVIFRWLSPKFHTTLQTMRRSFLGERISGA